DGKVFVLVGGKKATVAALKADSGEVAWAKAVTWKVKDKDVTDAASYSSPILIGEGKQRQLLCLTQQGLVSLGPATGALCWQVPVQDACNETSTTPARRRGYGA